jgi:hypothetical protein
LLPISYRALALQHDTYETFHHALLQWEYGMTLEALIAAGVFGWLVIGMVMMGLGIW